LLRIAIVGLGPWGICALERVVTGARHGLRPGLEVEVHVIEPGTPGSGVYDVTQPDYLLMNNACSQISLYPYASEADQPGYGIGLYEWAVGQGYRWVGDVCAVDRSGRPIEPHHFLPRRLMGEYLQWFYLGLVAGAPPAVHIVLHATMAVDLLERPDRSEEVCLATGKTVIVDHVIVTSGHTANQDDGHGALDPHQLSPYPVTPYVKSLPSEATVAVAGMGLVALDVVTALSVGRGGRFIEHGNGLRYQPSGQEPMIQMFSRSGLPYTAKSVTGTDLTGVYEPAICTPQAFDQLSGRLDGARRLVDVRTELLPLLFAEMCVRYYVQMAVRAGTKVEGTAVRERLRTAWRQGRFRDELAVLAERFGPFDAESVFFGHQPRYDSSDDYQRAVYDMLTADLREAEVPDGASPVKSATEVFRIFRDATRSVVEYGGLSLDSYLDFNADIRSRINRLVAGPPALRSRQLVALMDAGVLKVPYGPAPSLGPALGQEDPDPARARISSTALHNGHAADVDVVIRGHLDEPRIDGSASVLLSHLYDRGRVSQFRYGAVNVGSVDLTADAHPIDIDGRPQTRIWMFGVLTEGVRHFTHYIPSPKSRIRAFEDLGACVAEILA
jgi:uncharacterized NAD(P)/FAD-binding protein YdhS